MHAKLQTECWWHQSYAARDSSDLKQAAQHACHSRNGLHARRSERPKTPVLAPDPKMSAAGQQARALSASHVYSVRSKSRDDSHSQAGVQNMEAAKPHSCMQACQPRRECMRTSRALALFSAHHMMFTHRVHSQRQGRMTIVQSCMYVDPADAPSSATRHPHALQRLADARERRPETIKASRVAHAWCTGSVLDAPASAARLTAQHHRSPRRSGNETAMNLRQRESERQLVTGAPNWPHSVLFRASSSAGAQLTASVFEAGLGPHAKTLEHAGDRRGVARRTGRLRAAGRAQRQACAPAPRTCQHGASRAVSTIRLCTGRCIA